RNEVEGGAANGPALMGELLGDMGGWEGGAPMAVTRGSTGSVSDDGSGWYREWEDLRGRGRHIDQQSEHWQTMHATSLNSDGIQTAPVARAETQSYRRGIRRPFSPQSHAKGPLVATRLPPAGAIRRLAANA